MSKLIALKSGSHEILPDAWNSDFSYFKQQALLFDQIGILKLSQFYKSLENSMDFSNKLDTGLSKKLESIIMELEWLREKGVIFELTIKEEIQNQPLQHLGQELEDARKLLRRSIEIITPELENVENETRKIELMREQHFTILRVMSIIMETTKGVTAVTTFPYLEYNRQLPSSKKSDVAQIVINNLPLPNNETPWEQLIDYRNDPDNQKSLLTLRRWIRKVSTEELSKAEIQEEIEWLMNEFQNHMKFHNMKANTETLEVIVKMPLELLELQFSKILDPFIALKKRQINLLEAELNAPGKEMSYIIKARDAFQSKEGL